jgi:hypothetical protein
VEGMMSKLARNIELKQRGPLVRIHDVERVEFTKIQDTISHNSSAFEAYEIELSVLFGGKVFVRSTSDIVDVKENMRRAVVEAVFGEFRMPLIKLGDAIQRRSYKEAHDLCDIILSDMFQIKYP